MWKVVKKLEKSWNFRYKLMQLLTLLLLYGIIYIYYYTILLCLFLYIYFLHYMCYTISDPLIMTENMRFRTYSYPCCFGILISDGVVCLNMCRYAHHVSKNMTLCVGRSIYWPLPPPNLLYVYQSSFWISTWFYWIIAAVAPI